MKYIYIIFCFSMFFASCKTAKLEGPERFIAFGSGGGITGKVNVYRVSSFGKLYNDIAGGSSSEVKTHLTNKTLKNIFALADSLQKSTAPFSNPGNIYYFVSLKNNIENPDYTWGQIDFIVPEPISRLYHLLEKIQTASKTSKN